MRIQPGCPETATLAAPGESLAGSSLKQWPLEAWDMELPSGYDDSILQGRETHPRHLPFEPRWHFDQHFNVNTCFGQNTLSL